MPTLRELIEQLREVQRAMGRAANAARGDSTRKRELVAARRRYGDHLLIVAKAIDADPRLRADPELAREFRERFSAMRSKLAFHQAKWSAVLIDTSDEDFEISAAGVRESNDAFAAWALGVLK